MNRWIIGRIAVCLGLLLAVAPAQASAFSFADPLGFDAGTSAPRDLVSGDFDGDGDADVALVGSGGSAVSVLLGGPPATLGAPTSYNPASGNRPRAGIGLGDFNGDSDPDLITEDSDVFLGDPLLGSAAFADAGEFGATGNGGVAVGDFNADADPDAAFAAGNGDAVDIRLGGLGGTFTAGDSIPANDSDDVAVSNFNADEDAHLDVVIAAHDEPVLSVALGEGDGSFEAPVGLTSGRGQEQEQVAVGLLNDDSDPDLVVTRKAGNSVSVFLGGPGASFDEGRHYAVGSSPRAVGVADFNGDGNADIAVANYAAGTVSILGGDGSGEFADKVDFAAGTAPRQLVIGEFGGNPDPDLALADTSTDQVTLLINGDEPPPPPPDKDPVFRTTVKLDPVSGLVTYTCAGEETEELIEETLVPVGCLIDATSGRLALTSANPAGVTQTADFYGGAFKPGQVLERKAKGKKKKGKKRKKGKKVAITVLKLTGPSLECGAKKAGGGPVAQTARRRGLWGSGRGRFRSRGRRSSATVRGTVWYTQDSCKGTLTKVVEGEVAVKDFGLKKTVVLEPGDSYLASAKKP